MTLTNQVAVEREDAELEQAALAKDALDDTRVDDYLAALDPLVENGRILVVDDDARAAVMMKRLLEREGFTSVATAGEGGRALDLLMEHPTDVVVLDVHLPHVDGFEVLREIRRRDERDSRATGVLALSGDATSATCQAMLWAGADDFIARPFQSGEFALRVRRLASRTRALRRALSYARLLESRLRDMSRP